MSKNQAIRLIDEFLDSVLGPPINYLFFVYFFKKLSADLFVQASTCQLEGKAKADKLFSEIAGVIQSIVSGGVEMMIGFDKNHAKGFSRHVEQEILVEELITECSILVDGKKVLSYKYLQHVFSRLSQVDGLTSLYEYKFLDISNKFGQVERVLKRY